MSTEEIKTTKSDVKAMNAMMAILATLRPEIQLRVLCSLLIFCARDDRVKEVSDIVSQLFREDT